MKNGILYAAIAAAIGAGAYYAIQQPGRDRERFITNIKS